MDKRTIKSVILELKDEGKSFQDISDILAREYGVKMSRQAVYGMYKRLTSDEALNNNRIIMLATTDIVNYSVIGLDNYRIKDILASREVNISLNRINNILEESISYKNSLYNDLLYKISTKVQNGEDIESIKFALSYKGEKPTDNVINQLLSDYAVLEIKDCATKTLAKLFCITEDKNLVKNVSSKFNMNISSKELGRALNL